MSFFVVARVLVVFLALASLMLSWRASLIMIAALGMDFFGVIGGILPGGAQFALFALGPATVGFSLGALVCFRPGRMEVGDPAKLAAAVGIVLKLSWIDPELWRDLVRTWPAQLLQLVSFRKGDQPCLQDRDQGRSYERCAVQGCAQAR